MPTEDTPTLKLIKVRALTDAMGRAKAHLEKHPGPGAALDLQHLKLQRAELLATMPLRLVE
jgi:hypothetical protein